jgi:RHH-type proline utilization regulon transcriptional repressor/proline dehydrogenase/delta 1-pyrroline-5-carboxylate dehydrogenase
LPEAVQGSILLLDNPLQENFDAVLFHGESEALCALSQKVAEKDGPIVVIQGCRPGSKDIRLELLVAEKSFSINTAAAGGNASLMAVG